MILGSLYKCVNVQGIAIISFFIHFLLKINITFQKIFSWHILPAFCNFLFIWDWKFFQAYQNIQSLYSIKKFIWNKFDKSCTCYIVTDYVKKIILMPSNNRWICIYGETQSIARIIYSIKYKECGKWSQ